MGKTSQAITMVNQEISELPLVSIITPVKNGRKFLTCCIESILAQDYSNIEHVVADGGSSDGTVELLEYYSNKYKNKVRFISEPDEGVGDAWNKGLNIAKGEILGWVGADDYYEHNAVSTVVEFFRLHPTVHFAYGGMNVVSENGTLIRTYHATYTTLEEMVNARNPVPCPSAYYKKEVITKIGGLIGLGNDFEFFLRMRKSFEPHIIPEILSNFRIHSGSSTTGTNRKALTMWALDDWKVSRQYGGRFFSTYFRKYLKMLIRQQLQNIGIS